MREISEVSLPVLKGHHAEEEASFAGMVLWFHGPQGSARLHPGSAGKWKTPVVKIQTGLGHCSLSAPELGLMQIDASP